MKELMDMNRRNFLAGTVALAGQQKLLHSMGALSLGVSEARLAPAPHNLLSSTFTESFLETMLVTAGQWHPYPHWGERSPWEAVPEDIRSTFIERAEQDRAKGWTAFLASRFLDFKRNGNRSRFEADTFGRRAMLQHLVLAECMEGKGRFLDDIANGVWLICEESFWGVPAHLGAQRTGVGLPDVTEPIIDLFAAATVQLLAWIYYLMGEQLETISPLINKRIKIESERRILEPARTRNDFNWMGLDGKGARMNNWNPWINSNLMVANLILEDDPKLRIHEILRICRSIDQYLNQYWPDAGEEEGPGYFSVSPMCYYECVSFLDSATGASSSVLKNPFIGRMGRYIMNAHIAGDDYIDYGDAHVHASPDGDLLFRFAKAVNDPELQGFGAYCAAKNGWTAKDNKLKRLLDQTLTSMSRALPALLNASEVRNAPQNQGLVRDAWYPSMGLMTARMKADSADGMYMAVLAANNGRSHSHNDTGSYILYLDGKPVTIDVGVEAYTAKTFSPDRYSIWTMQSGYHNLPTVGGVMQRNGERFKATDHKYESDDKHAALSFNLAETYPKEAGVKKWIRTITLDRVRNQISIEENFELEHAAPISLSIITARTAAVQPGAITLKLAEGKGNDSLLKFNGAQIDPVVEKIVLSDASLRETWGDQIYRILLNTKQPAAQGAIVYEFSSI